MNKRPLSFLAATALFMAATHTASAVVNFVGISVPWIEGQTGVSPRRTDGDTVGGNSGWNAYVRLSGGSFLNSGDGASTRFSMELTPGTHNFEVLLQSTSWADNNVANPGSYVNLFFEQRNSPGISAKLAGGNTGALEALDPSDISQVINDAGGLAPPAGDLTFRSGLDVITLSALEMTYIGVGDQVQVDDAFPGGGDDSMISFTLDVTVIPEPSTSLLMLLGLGLVARRRR